MTNGKGLQFAKRHGREAAEMKPVLQLKYGEKSRKKPEQKALLDSKIYNSFYSEPQKSKRSLCSDGREINSIHHMTCSIVYITKKINFDFTLEIMALSRKTERVLKCHCKGQKRQKTNIRKSKTPTEVIPRRKRKSAQKKFLRIKNKIENLYLCWKKIAGRLHWVHLTIFKNFKPVISLKPALKERSVLKKLMILGKDYVL
ncbi:uncharacterized protein [Hemitrygon akajei]|uniref:uncharacterized protein isoform X2 n=1 Tax=Hemitrygon akajei TaxID=2704970 RepID=UPI003BF993D0